MVRAYERSFYCGGALLRLEIRGRRVDLPLRRSRGRVRHRRLPARAIDGAGRAGLARELRVPVVLLEEARFKRAEFRARGRKRSTAVVVDEPRDRRLAVDEPVQQARRCRVRIVELDGGDALGGGGDVERGLGRVGRGGPTLRKARDPALERVCTLADALAESLVEPRRSRGRVRPPPQPQYRGRARESLRLAARAAQTRRERADRWLGARRPGQSTRSARRRTRTRRARGRVGLAQPDALCGRGRERPSRVAAAAAASSDRRAQLVEPRALPRARARRRRRRSRRRRGRRAARRGRG